MGSIVRPRQMRLYWSIQDNVPLVSRKCADSEIRIVPISKTSDPRPATRRDLELLREVVDHQFGSGSYRELLPHDEVVLIGRVPYLDTAYEIIADGSILGHLFFDIYEFRWYFKPLEAAIYRIGNRLEKISKTAERGEYVGEASPSDPKFKLLENGLAERIRGRYIAVRTFKHVIAPLDSPNSLSKALSLNEPCVLARESEAIRFVWRISKRGKIIVSFSGGKDSSVLLEVVRRSDVHHEVYFNNTGLELPETLEFVERIGYDILGEAGNAFWMYVEKFGPPARDYRWCCKVLKLAPTYKALKSLAPGVTLVGQRRFESLSRRRSPRIWRNKWLPGFVTGTPINMWSALDIWLYIKLRGVQVNPLYERGFERLGCYLCPASRLSEFEKLKKWYPSLWERWSSFLSRYASKEGLGECWIRYGMWRWIHPPRRMEQLCSERRRALVTVALDSHEKQLTIDHFDKEAFLSLAHSLGAVRNGKISGRNFEVEIISPEEGLLAYKGELEEINGLIARSACTGCGVCKEYCEFGAIEIREKARILPDRCTRCGVCNDVCPLSFYRDRVVEVRSADVGAH